MLNSHPIFRVDRCRLGAGDVLVLKTDRNLTASQAEHLRESVAAGLGHALHEGLRVIVLDGGIEASVLAVEGPVSWLWRVLREMFAWVGVRNTGVWLYQENRHSGRRRVLRVGQGGRQPVSRAWLDGGSFGDHGPPPNQGSGGRKEAA